jgi:hypothetical protein
VPARGIFGEAAENYKCLRTDFAASLREHAFERRDCALAQVGPIVHGAQRDDVPD